MSLEQQVRDRLGEGAKEQLEGLKVAVAGGVTQGSLMMLQKSFETLQGIVIDLAKAIDEISTRGTIE